MIENKELSDSIEKMGTAMDFKNTRKHIWEVREKQQCRKLKELKTKIERALRFAETYGLTLDSASFCEQNGETHVFAFSEKYKHKGFKDVPEVDQEKIKQIADAAYHELTMTIAADGLPRSYLIRQCKDSLNELCHIERTPGKEKVNFTDELHSVIRRHAS